MEVGHRVDVGGNRGTIMYIGPVEGYNGEWVGVDWDDGKRGKHDGAVAGKRYFVARSGNSGSFVRPSNVIVGRRIDEEMKARYAVASKMDKFEIGVKMIDFVAMEKIYGKQRDIWKLRCVVLDGMHAAFPPLPNCLHFKFCTELNLYNNLLSRWNDLLNILLFFPSLLYLNIRKNYMESGMSSVSNDASVDAPVFHLVLSDTRSDHETVSRVLTIFPKLKQLYASSNGLRFFNIGESVCTLQLLDLEDNPIEDVANVLSLSKLSSLTSLNLSGCGLSNIYFDDPVGFASLQDLYLRNNALKGWDWIYEVAKLPSLIRLYVKGDKNLEEEFGANTREVIIAKLPRLLELDRCEISHLERRSAEILFVNRFGIAPVAPEHQRDVDRLKAIHGEPDVAQPISNVGINLLKLKFVSEGNEIVRSVPLSMSVQKLYGMASRLFHQDVRKMSLRAENLTGNITFDLDNPLRSLNFFDLSDGDVIRVCSS